MLATTVIVLAAIVLLELLTSRAYRHLVTIPTNRSPGRQHVCRVGCRLVSRGWGSGDGVGGESGRSR